MKLVINIPCYNEEKTLPLVLKDIPKKIKGISKIEVQIVDDGSTDKTVEVAKKYGVKRIIRHKQNMGLGVAFRTGIHNALKNGADIIVNIDGDGQFNSRDIPKLIQPILNQECDVTTVSRFLKESKVNNMPFLKKIGNFLFTTLINCLTGEKFTDTQCGFRAYSRDAAMHLNLKGDFTYTQEAFLNLLEDGMHIKEVASEINYYKNRKSFISGNLINYGLNALNIIIKTIRDLRPLKFFGIPGIFILSLGGLGGLYCLIYYLTHFMTSKIRQLFNVSVFFMIFGISLIILALLADMLRRINRTQDEILYRLKLNEYKKDK
ncbi:MAG: glycosyltransferase family 2 protein [Candidatus Goldbacteria bacterium]|nr:glycosyltransferase family 2 protein [Candidatus Goldiibacteriota bacterium]